MEAINLENVTFKMPYFMYSRLETLTSKQFILHSLPNGYGYLLQKIICSWPDVDEPAPNFNNEIYIELFDTASFKSRQINKLPLSLVSTYCNNLIRVSTPIAHPEYPTGELTSIIPINYFYPYSDIINLQVTSGTIASGNIAKYLDIVLMGYFIRRQDFQY